MVIVLFSTHVIIECVVYLWFLSDEGAAKVKWEYKPELEVTNVCMC